MSPLLIDLSDTRDHSVHPASLWAAVPGQTVLSAMLGPPPNQRPWESGVPFAAQTHALQPVPNAWGRSVEPPRPGPTRLPPAECVRSRGSGLLGWPEQQVGEGEHVRFAGGDSRFRAGCRTPAGTRNKERRHCNWSQLVKLRRWSTRRNALNLSTVSLNICPVLLISLSLSVVISRLPFPSFLLFPQTKSRD